ncbi:MAG: DUF4040 domain-containing protein [Puniceicoccaceae bacterium]|nr:MAG: DUF4040 domain-containing protein [Puniceicoccaceae bacterium]
MGTALLIAIFLPFAALVILPLAGRVLGPRVGWLALVFPVISAGIIINLALGTESFGQQTVAYTWVPVLGVELSFLVDGLSLFYGLVVSVMGVLITFYAANYLDGHYEFHGRFYAYLMLFMAAMLGTVFANHLVLLFIFWELTGISSFLLIGFLHGEKKSRYGARMALLVTGITGLVLMAGLLLLGIVAGEFSMAALLTAPPTDVPVGLLGGAFLLVAIGSFGKSAQFPFHFWLPNAMAAPTPVSAYLHSATMVKLGVFMVARVYPIFVDLEWWTPLLVAIGFLTMALAAVLAILSHDLKAILAYSTVSQLGFLIGFYGMGGLGGTHYDLLHVVNHVFFKGCLFMVVGIVDHATHTRDLRQLGGLGRRMPLLAVIALLSAASMAGLPGTLGFLSKEYMLKDAFYFAEAGADWRAWYPLALIVLASVLKVAFSIRLFWGIFGGAASPAVKEHFHHPGLLIQLPPLLLAACCLVFGFAPGAIAAFSETLAVGGLHLPGAPEIKLWHGVTRELITSMAIVAAGAVIFALGAATAWRWARIPLPLQFDTGFEAGVERLPKAALNLSRFLRDNKPLDYIPVIGLFLVVFLGGYFAYHWERFEVFDDFSFQEGFHYLRSFVVLLILLAVIGVVALPRWTTQLLSISIVGFLVTFYFVLFRAPDLAMTQILVESATLLLVLLLLSRFPRSAELGERRSPFSPLRKAVNLIVAVGIGGCVGLFSFLTSRQKVDDFAGLWFLERTVPDAKGTNAVNTILVDFRGLDTLFEIAVLVIAVLGAIGLLMRYRRSRQEYAEGALGASGFSVKGVRRRQ